MSRSLALAGAAAVAGATAAHATDLRFEDLGAQRAITSVSAYGATCDDAALAAAAAAGRTIVIDRICAVSSDLALSGMTMWLVERGGGFRVANRKALTFADGATIVAGPYQIFSGPGAVRGLAFPKPEWWGDADQAASVQAAHDSAKFAALHRGVLAPRNTKYGVDLGCGFYTFARTVALSPVTWFPLQFTGCAAALGGTRIMASETFEGEALVDLVAPSSASEQNASFDVGQFQLVNNSAYSATSLLRIGKDDGTSFNPTQQNRIHDIDFENFVNAIEWRNGRLIEFRRIGMFSTAPRAYCLNINPTSSAGSFVGDADFYQMNCTPCRGTLASCSTGGSYTRNIWIKADHARTGVAGLRFHAWVGYYSAKNVEIAASNGAAISDIWIETGSQFDGHGEEGGPVNGGIVEATATGTGSIIQNINIGNIYARASSPKHVGSAFTFSADADAAAGAGVNSINMEGTWIANDSAGGILAHNVRGLKIDAIFASSGFVGQTAVRLEGSTSDVTIHLDMQYCLAPYIYDYAVVAQDTVGNVKVSPSAVSGCVRSPSSNSSRGTGIDLSGLWPRSSADGPSEAKGLATLLGSTVASLPSCNSGAFGRVAYVTDASAAIWGARISGGGATKTLAICNGTNWVAR
ncbi:hypothetical protein MSC49_10450 [Methylosinus sp. C49]|uniref:hypothetical protein n=1 Tax=Methylosinus sp. C49 TaxID=2699395 RepID=UPI00136704B9|nr:hypothetical protein [Methylosinus sp. C49]BBU61110.1 hypothetical protein MSC49_10450 [Methylosinus sp. C49]